MPKLIDHQQRREEIAAAAWRVIRRDGVAGASVRTVAAEAGLSVGSIRHVFGTQSELLAFAMTLVMQRVDVRVADQLPLGTPHSAEEIAAEFLPLDEERRAEMEVYLALFAAAGVDPGLSAVRDETWQGTRVACAMIIARIDTANELTDDQREYETVRLHALLDGLAAHLVWQRDPNPESSRRVLVRHLRSVVDGARS
ncbi:MAG: TetR/AcrR family transcriptional regulator [Propionibacteriaceae bacterium]